MLEQLLRSSRFRTSKLLRGCSRSPSCSLFSISIMQGDWYPHWLYLCDCPLCQGPDLGLCASNWVPLFGVKHWWDLPTVGQQYISGAACSRMMLEKSLPCLAIRRLSSDSSVGDRRFSHIPPFFLLFYGLTGGPACKAMVKIGNIWLPGS